MEAMYLIYNWLDVVRGLRSNYEFFIIINTGWLKMQFKTLYGDNPTEQQHLEWMLQNAEKIYLSEKDYDSFLKRFQ